MPPRVIIADDHGDVLTALTRILERHGEVVSTAVDGVDLLRRVDELVPDVVITDIFMPRMNGLDACGHIRRHYPAVKVVVMSSWVDQEVITSAFEVGATAVIRKGNLAAEAARVLASP
jgi:CheY-like chemotaxis protein